MTHVRIMYSDVVIIMHACDVIIIALYRKLLIDGIVWHVLGICIQ